MPMLTHLNNRRRLLAACALVAGALLPLLPAGRIHAAGPRITAVSHTASSVATYRVIDLSVALAASYSNPFDPAQIDLHAIFTAPSGTRYTVNGFYYQNYTLAPDARGNRLPRAQGAPQWLIRFAAPTPGMWTYTIYLHDSTGQSATSTQGSPIQVRRGQLPGDVRVSPHDPRYLAFDNGKTYLPVGENLAWYDLPSSNVQDYASWLNGPGKLHAQGVNFVRIWLSPRSFGVDNALPLGNYLSRLSDAWNLDYVLNLALQDNIYVQLALEQHDNFRDTNWANSPYNSANGGPLQRQCDFFTNPTALAMTRRYLRYVVARWGYASNIVDWELFNEFDLVYNRDGSQIIGRCDPNAVLRWHQAMITTLHTLDPFHHLISTSAASLSGDARIWTLPGIDIVQGHDYNGVLPATVAADIARMRRYGKPAWLGEFGLHSHVWQYTDDEHGTFIHLDQWASVMSGAAGSGFPWYWDHYVDQNNLYSVFHGLPDFIAGIQFDRQGFRPDPMSVQAVRDGVRASIFTLRGRSLSLLWVYAGAHPVDRGARGFGRISLPWTGRTPVHVQWWDTARGTVISISAVTPRNGALTVALPGTGTDYAAKISG